MEHQRKSVVGFLLYLKILLVWLAFVNSAVCTLLHPSYNTEFLARLFQ